VAQDLARRALFSEAKERQRFTEGWSKKVPRAADRDWAVVGRDLTVASRLRPGEQKAVIG
jgi:hypothetical protein